MDERLVARLKTLFARLRKPIALADEQGSNLLSDDGEPVYLPEALAAGEPLYEFGQGFLRSEAAGDYVWVINAANETDAADALTMADAMLAELLEIYPDAAGPEHLYRQLLLTEDGDQALSESLNANGIVRKRPRCVLVMETEAQWHGDFLRTMRTILPAGPSDAVVSVGRNTVAYLVDMSTVDDRTDLLEYASVAQESALSESGCSVLIGVGGCASDIVGLHTSYEQACEALRVGKLFLPKETVFDYERMLMPRFLSELDPEVAAKYYYMLFNAENAKLFSEELLETVSMFFEKDLNLSDTARQLYIHRNTLTYRLDKIEKITGLDLRRFDDAVTFRMLMEMKKCIK